MKPGINILFIQDNGINESLALTELAAYLERAGHHCQVLLEREERRFGRVVQSAKPDLIIMPCNVFGAQWVVATARRLARLVPKVPLLVGGTHPTLSPDLLEESAITYQLVGEAEIAVTELARRLGDGTPTDDISGIWVRVDGAVRDNGVAPRLDHMSEIPLPDRSIYYRYPFLKAFPWKKFSTGRGCENRCSFCHNEHVRKLYCDEGFVRRKSVDRVLDEVLAVKERSTLRWVHFADDLFVTNREWLATFAHRYPGRIGLPFSCNSSADRMDDNVAQTLARAGCRVVAVGVETADEERRIRILHKPSPDPVLERAAAAVIGAGMELVTFLMLALPGEQLADSLATIRFSHHLGAHAHRIMMAVPLPGTEMTREAALAGHVSPELADNYQARIDFHDNPYGPFYRVGEPQAFENLANLAPLLHHLPDSAALTLTRVLPRRLTRMARLWMSFQEKRLYKFSLLEGIRFYLHVGNPMHRTTNYVSLL